MVTLANNSLAIVNSHFVEFFAFWDVSHIKVMSAFFCQFNYTATTAFLCTNNSISHN